MGGYFGAMLDGAGHVLAWPNILIPLAGTLIAMISSFLPGIGGTSLATLALVATLHWEPLSVLLLFGALTGGATFMGSITAILFNIPGNAAAAAAQLDGHAISRAGYPKMAIATAATASALGSLVGVVILIALLPLVRPLILQFGPLERVLLGLWGLSAIIAVPNASALKACAATALGFLAALVGTDPATGMPRWAFGSIGLYDGFALVAVLLGFFTLSELVAWRRNVTLSAPPPLDAPQDTIRGGVRAVLEHWRLMLRSSVIGSVVGIVPGVGGTVAGFVAYGQAVQTAREGRERFGTGDIRGLIAPESAVDAKDGGSLLPAVAFGLPGSEAGVLLVTVLLIHGFVPGLPMLTADLPMTFALIFALLLSNITTSVVGVAATPLLARLTRLPIERVVLPVLLISLVTLVELNGNVADVSVAVGFGILGYLFGHFRWPRIPFVIAFVLGGFIEENLALTAQLVQADRIALVERPVALGLILVLGLTLLFLLRGVRMEARRGAALPGERWFAAGLAAAAAGLAAVAVAGGYGQTGRWVAAAAALLAAAVALRPAAAAQGAGMPRDHAATLWMLAALPVAVWLAGLMAAAAAFALVWLAVGSSGPAWSLRRLAWPLAGAALTAAAAWVYLETWAVARLPSPQLAGLF